MVDVTSQPITYKLRPGSSLFTDKRGIRPRTAAAKLFINKRDAAPPEPRPKSSQLASVKHSMYNPRLPSLRQMDRDTAIHRLSNEHSRHTTYATPEEFQMCRLSPEPPLLSRNQLTDTKPTTISELQDLRDWRQLIFQQEEGEPLVVRGYVPRRLPYDVMSSWKYTLREEPEIDYTSYNPKPVPATVYSRYRGTWASTANSNARPWRH